MSPFALLALLVVVGCAWSTQCEPLPDNTGSSLPYVIALNDANFNQTVFGEEEKSRPYFILFYAPWCQHCKAIKPIFSNASNMIHYSDGPQHGKELKRGDGAIFAMVDATENNALAKRFRIRSFPTFFYTVRGKAYQYHGRRGLTDFLFFSRYLHLGHAKRSFATGIRTGNELAGFLASGEQGQRMSFVFFVDSASNEVVQRAVRNMNAIIDATVSHGATNFATIVGESSMKVTHNPGDADTTESDRTVERVHNTIKKALNKQHVGPNGEVLVVVTDAFAVPVAYSGLWNGAPLKSARLSAEEADLQATASESSMDPLICFIKRYCHPAVSEITAESFPVLARSGLLAIAITDGPAPIIVKQTLRDVVQQRNNARIVDCAVGSEDDDDDEEDEVAEGKKKRDKTSKKTQLTFALLDGQFFSAWIEQFGYTKKHLPTFIVVDALKDTLFRDDATLRPLLVRTWNHDMAWETVERKPAAEAIARFAALVESHAVAPEKYTMVGRVAQLLLDYVPYAGKLHAFLGGDDTSLLAACASVVFLIFVTFLAMRRGPDEVQRRDDAPNPRKETRAKKEQ